MDKPRILEVRKKSERQPDESPAHAGEEGAEEQREVGRRQEPGEDQPQAIEQAPEAAEQAEAAERPQHPIAAQAPEPVGLTELERSVLEEMRKRGEITAEEERKIVEEVKVEEKESTAKQEKESKPKEEHEIEVAAEESKPRVVEERDYSLVAKPQVKPLIKQERVAGVVIREESTLEKEKREQASRDVQPVEAEPGTPFASERERAAEIAKRIWEQKQRDKSIFYRVGKMLGFR